MNFIASVGRVANFAKWRIKEAYEGACNVALYDRREPHKVWEVYTLKRLFQQFPIDCVFDVGANRGGYAKMLRREVGYRGRIVSFEPIPELAQRIRRQARRDPLWTVEEVALSDKDGTAEFHVMVNQEFSSLLDPSAEHTSLFVSTNSISQSIPVKTERLDSAYLRLHKLYNFKNPFLKMDTQGNDTRIVMAGLATAKNFVALQSELSFIPIYDEAEDFNYALNLYKQAGFKLSAWIQNNAGHFPNLIECDCLMVRADCARMDFFADSAARMPATSNA